jgi:NAD(P)-dependent dehydrogenase (short-subunit alcohol dehydrogenase family)
MVTGATGGIGEITATALARNGATVVVVGRSREKAIATVEKIKKATGNQKVEYMLADLSSQKDVRHLAEEFKAKYDRLHVLVNNAGALYTKREESVDGIELTFALNHLGYFLLTNLLLDTIKASAPARIVNVSSSMHRRGTMDWQDLEGKKKFSGWAIYGRSKLANILFTRELARRLEGSGVTVNALHPGVVTTGFGTNNGMFG